MTVGEILHSVIVLGLILAIVLVVRDGRKQAAKQAGEKVDQNTKGKQK